MSDWYTDALRRALDEARRQNASLQEELLRTQEERDELRRQLFVRTSFVERPTLVLQGATAATGLFGVPSTPTPIAPPPPADPLGARAALLEVD